MKNYKSGKQYGCFELLSRIKDVVEGGEIIKR